jgi:hypothetical protein
MRGYLWLLVAVFIIGVIYPPAALAIGHAALVAGFVVWLLLLMLRSD